MKYGFTLAATAAFVSLATNAHAFGRGPRGVDGHMSVYQSGGSITLIDIDNNHTSFSSGEYNVRVNPSRDEIIFKNRQTGKSASVRLKGLDDSTSFSFNANQTGQAYNISGAARTSSSTPQTHSSTRRCDLGNYAYGYEDVTYTTYTTTTSLNVQLTSGGRVMATFSGVTSSNDSTSGTTVTSGCSFVGYDYPTYTPSEPSYEPSEPSYPSNPGHEPGEPNPPAEPIYTPSEPSNPGHEPGQPNPPAEPVHSDPSPSNPGHEPGHPNPGAHPIG